VGEDRREVYFAGSHEREKKERKKRLVFVDKKEERFPRRGYD